MNPDTQEVAAGREREELEGWIPELASEAEINAAFEKAFDYRGDVTLTLKDGRVIQGYVFDRRTGATLAESVVRVIPANEPTKVSVPYAEIAALTFPGATRLRENHSRPGCESTGKRRWPARRISASSRKH